MPAPMPSCRDRTAGPGSARARTPAVGEDDVERPRRARRIAGAALLATGAALLLATVLARPLDREVSERIVRVADDPSGAPDPGVPDGEGAFAFAVVGPATSSTASGQPSPSVSGASGSVPASISS